MDAQLDEIRRRLEGSRQDSRIDLAELIKPHRLERDRGIYELTPEIEAAIYAEIAERERALRSTVAITDPKWR